MGVDDSLDVEGAFKYGASGDASDVGVAEAVCKPPQTELGYYRSDIDGLRAIAVIAVVIYHMRAELMPGGFAGVDMFFVISGYVVTGSFLRHEDENGPISRMLSFYARRIQRLLPGFAIVCFITGLLMALVLSPEGKYNHRCYTAGMFSTIGASNLFLAFFEGNYFDVGVDTMALCAFKHTWSLGVEEQFYCTVPALLLLFPRHQMHVLSVSVLASMLASFLIGVNSSKLAFYLLPSRFWEMAAGSLLHMVLQSYNTREQDHQVGQRTSLSIAFQLASVLLICTALVCTPSSTGFPFPWALLSVCGTLCFITAGSFQDSMLNRVLGMRLFVYIGKISYLIYLWHWPIVALVESTFTLSTEPMNIPMLNIYTVSSLSIMCLSAVCYHFVETPFRSWRPEKRSSVFVIMLVTTAVLLSSLAMLRGPLHGLLFMGPAELDSSQFGGGGLDTGVPRSSSNASAGQPGAQDAKLQRTKQRKKSKWRKPSNRSINATQFTGELRMTTTSMPSQADAGCKCNYLFNTSFKPPGAVVNASHLTPCAYRVQTNNVWEQSSCWNHGLDTSRSRIARCLTVRRSGEQPVMFLLGDSHAAMISTGVRLAVQRVMAFNWFAMGYGCGMIGTELAGSAELLWKSCRTLQTEVLKVVMIQLRAQDVIVIANSNDHKPGYFGNDWCPGHTPCVKGDGGVGARYRSFIASLHANATSRGASLVLFGDAPQQKFATPRETCVPTTRHPTKFEGCRRPWKESCGLQELLNKLNADMAAKLEIPYLTYRGLLCLPPKQTMSTVVGQPAHTNHLIGQSRFCYPFVPGTGMLSYIDQSHLSEMGAIYLWPFLCAAMESAGVLPTRGK